MNLTRNEMIILSVAFIVALFLLGMVSLDPPKPTQPTVVTSYEDGSVVWSDGTTSCDPTALCAK